MTNSLVCYNNQGQVHICPHAKVYERIFVHSFVCYRSRVLATAVLDMQIEYSYGVATISRLLKITGLFCRISSLL